MRVICLGFDGASPELVEKWKRDLPNFSRVMAEGAWGRLKSVVPPVSPQAWSSFATGRNPGKHGIFGFKRKKPRSYALEFVTGAAMKAKPIWCYLSEHGKRVVVVNIPVTYPPVAVNGVLLSGMDAPGKDCEYTYPRELRQEIERLFPDYVISLHFGGYLTSEKRIEEAIGELLHEADVRTRVFLHLLARGGDFAAVKYNLTDLAHHYFWRFMDEHHPGYDPDLGSKFSDAIFRVYRKADGCIGIVRERFPDATIILLSDHGGGSARNKTVYLNEWLRAQGLLVPKKTGGGVRGRVTETLESAMLCLMRHLSGRAKDSLRRLLPGLRSRVVSWLKFANIEWSRTKAFAGESYGAIRINRAGEYPEGIVEPGEYEALRSSIIRGLEALTDPDTGERCFEKVFRREDIYAGAFVADAPDLIAITTDLAYFMSAKLRKGTNLRVVEPKAHWRGVSGVHRLHGIVGAVGPGVKGGVELANAEIIDLAPTILHLMGLPIPRDYDGKVLVDMLEDSGRAPVYAEDSEWHGGAGGTYTKEDEAKVAETLRGLGYIE